MAKKNQNKTAKTKNLTYQDLKTIAPRGRDEYIRMFVDGLNQYADEFGIDTPLRKVHFIAQMAHESDSFKALTEYSAGKNRYSPYDGRGFVMLTWRENYMAFYEWCVNRGLNPPEFFRPNLVGKAAEFPWAFLSAVWYWETRKLNRWADEDNVRQITRIINGGYNGLNDRINYLNKAKKYFNIATKDVDVSSGTILPQYTVRQIQEALVRNGIKVVIDGKNGPQTTAGVKLYQKLNGLVPDGIVGPATAARMFK